jgi:hypothetical protein
MVQLGAGEGREGGAEDAGRSPGGQAGSTRAARAAPGAQSARARRAPAPLARPPARPRRARCACMGVAGSRAACGWRRAPRALRGRRARRRAPHATRRPGRARSSQSALLGQTLRAQSAKTSLSLAEPARPSPACCTPGGSRSALGAARVPDRGWDRAGALRRCRAAGRRAAAGAGGPGDAGPGPLPRPPSARPRPPRPRRVPLARSLSHGAACVNPCLPRSLRVAPPRTVAAPAARGRVAAAPPPPPRPAAPRPPAPRRGPPPAPAVGAGLEANPSDRLQDFDGIYGNGEASPVPEVRPVFLLLTFKRGRAVPWRRRRRRRRKPLSQARIA